MLSQRIRRQLAPMLTKQTYLLQAQWIKPQANKGQKGFFSVTLADTDNPNMAIDAMIWEPAVIRKVLEQGQQFGHDLLSRDSRVEVVVEGAAADGGNAQARELWRRPHCLAPRRQAPLPLGQLLRRLEPIGARQGQRPHPRLH
jgi:hypothetical protein